MRLLAAPGRRRWLSTVRLAPALLRRLVTLPTGDLAPLARAVRDHRGFAALLDAMPPARRTGLYEAALTEVDRSGYEPGPLILEALPAAARIAEARRLLAKDKIRTEDEVRRLSAYLAWPDASGALEDGLRAGDAEERAVAWRLLVDAARRSRDPQVVADLVSRLGRLRNEQDPVRSAALNALARVARLLSVAAVPMLTRLTTDAVDARDASATTTAALATLAADTLQHHIGVPELSDWALLTIDLAGTSATVPVLRRFDAVLRRGQEVIVFERLRGWIEASVARGRYAPLFAVTRALGRRAWKLPELQAMLGRAAGRGTVPWVATEAVALWLEDPHHRSVRAGEVLAADPSAVALTPVWTVVSTERTDLIARVLRDAPAGRFVDGKVRWVPGWAARPERWPSRQRSAFVALLGRIVADTGTDIWRRAGALRAAAPVPGAGRDLVLRHLDDPAVVLAEAALGALAGTDRPDEALPVLLGYARGDRARVAMYAAGRAARYTPPSALPGLLGPLLSSSSAKVTSRKEAARLLARYGTAQVLTTLLAAYRDPAAHRDVRAAITSAARQRLDAPVSWTILRTAGGGSREERRAVLAVGPYGIGERFRPGYAELIGEACRTGDREVRRLAFTQLPGWMPWAPGLGGLIEDRLTDLSERRPPVEVGRLAAALDAGALLRTVERLADREEADDRPGGPDADHPARRRLEALADGTGAWVTVVPAATDRSAPIAAARRLAARPAFTQTAVTMLVGLGELTNLDEVADLCGSRPGLAFRASDKVRAGLHRLAVDPEVLRSRVAGLAARGDLAGGLFAVALISKAAAYDWPLPWRELLTELRHHPDADVRDEAWSTVDMTGG